MQTQSAQTPPSSPPENKLSVRESFNAGINLDTRVDWERGIVFDVELMGPTSENGKDYTPEAIREAMTWVEKVGSYIDHPQTERNDRSIKERFGKFAGPYINSQGRLCAREFKYDKANQFAPSFEWMLKHCPNEIGFSINADAGGGPVGDRIQVRRIYECHGFDLVDRPATTGGIFAIRESVQKRIKAISIREAKTAMFPEAFKVGVNELVAKLTDGSIDTSEAMKRLKDLLKLLDPASDAKPEEATAEEEFTTAESKDQPTKAMESARKSKYKWIQNLATQIDVFQVREQQAKAEKEKEERYKAREAKAISKFGADAATLMTTTFKALLANANTDADVDALITDRLSVREQKGGNRDTPISAGNSEKKIEDVVKSMFGGEI